MLDHVLQILLSFFTAKLKAETDSKNMHNALDCLERTLPLPATTPLPQKGSCNVYMQPDIRDTAL